MVVAGPQCRDEGGPTSKGGRGSVLHLGIGRFISVPLDCSPRCGNVDCRDGGLNRGGSISRRRRGLCGKGEVTRYRKVAAGIPTSQPKMIDRGRGQPTERLAVVSHQRAYQSGEGPITRGGSILDLGIRRLISSPGNGYSCTGQITGR